MSTLDIASPTTHRLSIHPVVAAGFGASMFAATMTAGRVFDLNANSADASPVTLGEFALQAVLVGVAVALAGWLGVRALAREPKALQRTAMGLAVGAALTFVVFWSGWPLVLGAVAVALALEHRRRVGSFSVVSLVSTVVGTLAFIAAAVVCVIG